MKFREYIMESTNFSNLPKGTKIKFNFKHNGSNKEEVVNGTILHKATKWYGVEALFDNETKTELIDVNVRDIIKVIN